MRRFAVGIGLLALGAGLVGGRSPALAQASGESVPPPARSLAHDITSRLDPAPSPEAPAHTLGVSSVQAPDQPRSRELHRAMERAAGEVRRDR